MAAGEFIPQSIGGSTNCDDGGTSGRPSTRFDYIVKSVTSGIDYPPDTCLPWLHASFQADNVLINENIEVTGIGSFAGGIVLTASDNSKWKLVVDTSGNLTTTPA